MSHGEFWSAASALATIAASLITALSLLFLVIQLREQRRYTLAKETSGFTGKNVFGCEVTCFSRPVTLVRPGRAWRINSPRSPATPALIYLPQGKKLVSSAELVASIRE